jgi:hypothetical protein
MPTALSRLLAYIVYKKNILYEIRPTFVISIEEFYAKNDVFR